MKSKKAVKSGAWVGALIAVGIIGGLLALTRNAAAEEEIRLAIKNHEFHPSEIRVKAHTKIKLLVTNEDSSVEEFESFSLNREKLIRPGQTATIFLPALKPGTYVFFGEFHPKTARGKIIVE